MCCGAATRSRSSVSRLRRARSRRILGTTGMEPFVKLYESAQTLAEARTKLYHGAQGAYFPETMTVFGTYSGGDYGWDRTGHQPRDVLCPWWQYAWNQGPELVALMLDRWDYS